MILEQYPGAIYDQEMRVLSSRDEVYRGKTELARFDASIESAIAADGDLKNEQQRKAARLKAREQDAYKALVDAIREGEHQAEMQQVDLNRLRNEFAVSKLQAREAIAKMEAVS